MASDREQLRAAGIQVRARVSDELGDVWWSLLARGLLALALGVAALFWPQATLVLLILAAIQTAPDDPDRAPAMAIGAVAAVVGLILAFWPGTGAVTIAWTIGIAALLIGASLVYLALRLRKLDRRVENLRRR